MSSAQALGVGVLGLVLSTPALYGQKPAQYRDFQLGSDVAAVAALTGVAVSDAKTVRSRPATLQELRWRRAYAGLGAAVDPVEQIAFSFYHDQLFRLVIDYGRDQTEGMTDADMVDAISTMYGAAVKPPVKAARAALAGVDEESGIRVAGWGNHEYTAVLYRSSEGMYGSPSFSMIVTSIRLRALAQTAESQAVRLDERDAPQRERARQKKEADDERVAKAKARQTNKAAFKP